MTSTGINSCHLHVRPCCLYQLDAYKNTVWSDCMDQLLNDQIMRSRQQPKCVASDNQGCKDQPLSWLHILGKWQQTGLLFPPHIRLASASTSDRVLTTLVPCSSYWKISSKCCICPG